MKTTLDLEIENINNSLLAKLTAYKYLLSGLVFEVQKNDGKINVDINNNPIVFDDKFEIYIYHKLSAINFNKIQSRGKTNVYEAKATVNIFAFTIFRNFHDVLVANLSELPHVLVEDIDFDSYKIIKNETGKDSFDFVKRFVFSLKYTVTYRTEKCDDICLR
jgi:hypothetical protein